MASKSRKSSRSKLKCPKGTPLVCGIKTPNKGICVKTRSECATRYTKKNMPIPS